MESHQRGLRRLGRLPVARCNLERKFFAAKPLPCGGSTKNSSSRVRSTRFSEWRGAAAASRTFWDARDSLEFLVVTIGPAADTAQRDDERPSQLGQGILDCNGLGSRHLPGDQSHGLKIAKRSSEHSLRDVSQTTSQPPVTLWPFFQRGHDLDGPLPDEKRGHHIRPAAKSIVHFALAPRKEFLEVRRSLENCLFILPLQRRAPSHLVSLLQYAQEGTRVYLLDKNGVPEQSDTRARFRVTHEGAGVRSDY